MEKSSDVHEPRSPQQAVIAATTVLPAALPVIPTLALVWLPPLPAARLAECAGLKEQKILWRKDAVRASRHSIVLHGRLLRNNARGDARNVVQALQLKMSHACYAPVRFSPFSGPPNQQAPSVVRRFRSVICPVNAMYRALAQAHRRQPLSAVRSSSDATTRWGACRIRMPLTLACARWIWWIRAFGSLDAALARIVCRSANGSRLPIPVGPPLDLPSMILSSAWVDGWNDADKECAIAQANNSLPVWKKVSITQAQPTRCCCRSESH
jgi:hypothetical protein